MSTRSILGNDCPNCGPNPGEPPRPLYVNDLGVTHCGCFYERAQSDVRAHVSDPVPGAGFDEDWGCL